MVVITPLLIRDIIIVGDGGFFRLFKCVWDDACLCPCKTDKQNVYSMSKKETETLVQGNDSRLELKETDVYLSL